jgi:hypothetical protein
MRSFDSYHGAALAAAFLSVLSLPAFADPALPQPVHQGNVTYISGGVGAGEQHALEADAHNYDLAITNANKTGDFTLNTALDIRAKNGRDILQAADTGPLFYAKLPPGNYVIHATNEGQQRTREVKIAPNHTTDVHLVWPQQG